MSLPTHNAARNPVNDTCPTHAREIFDELERRVGALHPRSQDAGLHGDLAREVPGSSEPPD